MSSATLEAKIALNASAFNKGYNSVKSQIGKLGGIVAGAFTVYGIKKFIDGLDQISETSKKLGIFNPAFCIIFIAFS